MADSYPILTVKNPWAWCFIAPVPEPKRIENRGREMKHRGPLWLHAGARSGWDIDGEMSPLVSRAWSQYAHSRPDFRENIMRLQLLPDTEFMPFGAVTALLSVTGCHHSDECMFPLSQELPGVRSGCSPWAARGQWHIETDLLATLPEPVPCRGALGLWRLPEDVEKAVREQLEATL